MAHPESAAGPPPAPVLVGLARPLTPLVAREDERAAVRAALVDPDARLVTLTGPGGVGKTRLALALADDLAGAFADGCVAVGLAGTPTPDLVPATVAAACGLSDAGQVAPAQRLERALRDRRLLLVLDNFEHVVGASSWLAELLDACPAVVALVTSRVRLRVQAEWVVAVPALAVPAPGSGDDPVVVGAAPAVRLFVARAGDTDPAFRLSAANAGAVAGIVRRLDGLPLALELAAARTAVLPPSALLERLDRALSVLADGPRDLPERQRTMRGAVAWSHDLLPPGRQVLFRRLAVFAGGFTLHAAEILAAGWPTSPEEAAGTDDDPTFAGLAALVETSLVRREPGRPDEDVRYAMLESVREFGAERLTAHGERDEARRRHALLFLALAEQAAERSFAPDNDHWFARLTTELENLRSALAWAIEAREPTLAHRLAIALWWFWYHHGHLSEGGRWFDGVLALGDPDDPDLRVRALTSAGHLAHYRGAEARSAALLEEALALARDRGDEHGIRQALFMLGIGAEDRGDYERATAAFAEALRLFETAGERRFVALSRYHLGIVAYGRGDLGRARALLEEALRLAPAEEDDFTHFAALGYLGLVLCDLDPATAADALARALAWDLPSGHLEGVGRELAGAGVLAEVRGRHLLAARLLGAAAAVFAGLGYAVALPERGRHESAAAEARSRLGADAFADAFAAGRALDAEQAAALAAGELAALASPDAAAARIGLSPRELEVLRLVAEGASDKAIAAALSISPRTAMGHVARLLAKLDAPSRAAAAARARDEGLV